MLRDQRENMCILETLEIIESVIWGRNWKRATGVASIHVMMPVHAAVGLLNDIITGKFNESFPLIKVKVPTRDPPYMSPLVKHLCTIRNKNMTKDINNDRQERINSLIRENQVRAVYDENKKYSAGSKGWWNTVNKITGRGTKNQNVSSIIDPHV